MALELFSNLKVRAAFLLFLSMASCPSLILGAPFDEISPHKNFASNSKFQVIDDFDSGISQSHVQTKWEMRGSGGSEISATSISEDGFKKWGRAAQLNYTISKHSSVEFFVPLEGLDVSRAKGLMLLVKTEELNTLGNITVSLSDMAGHQRAADLKQFVMTPTPKTVQSGWSVVDVPIQKFQLLDLSRLERLTFLIESENASHGQITFDELAFFGTGDLVFDSHRDNLIAFPKQTVQSKRREALLRPQADATFFMEIAKDTWGYFRDETDRDTGLLVDHIRLGKQKSIGSYISPTNIAFYWLACVAASELEIISKQEAIKLVRKSFESFKKLERWENGFLFNFYQTRSSIPTRRYVSTVDNGWLAAALVVLRQAFPNEFGAEATAYLDELDFSKFYDSKNGQLRIGYDADKHAYAPYHYGLLVTEARIASYVAIGKGDIGREHWAKMYRTLPGSWEWQKQAPGGAEKTLFGVPVFEGHYTHAEHSFVPSWGGSLFEFLAPTLVVDEQAFAPKSLGKNNRLAAQLHVEYALHEKGYPVWGLAPCAIQNGNGWSYREYGAPELGAKGYSDLGIVAPYASLLAIEIDSDAVSRNAREFLSRYKTIYGPYGFYDSVQVSNSGINPQYLALDQGMIFIAIANYLKHGTIRNYFHQDPVGKVVQELIQEEEFLL